MRQAWAVPCRLPLSACGPRRMSRRKNPSASTRLERIGTPPVAQGVERPTPLARTNRHAAGEPRVRTVTAPQAAPGRHASTLERGAAPPAFVLVTSALFLYNPLRILAQINLRWISSNIERIAWIGRDRTECRSWRAARRGRLWQAQASKCPLFFLLRLLWIP